MLIALRHAASRAAINGAIATRGSRAAPPRAAPRWSSRSDRGRVSQPSLLLVPPAAPSPVNTAPSRATSCRRPRSGRSAGSWRGVPRRRSFHRRPLLGARGLPLLILNFRLVTRVEIELRPIAVRIDRRTASALTENLPNGLSPDQRRAFVSRQRFERAIKGPCDECAHARPKRRIVQDLLRHLLGDFLRRVTERRDDRDVDLLRDE